MDKMDKKNLIISNLEKLKNIYLQDESKKWSLKALSFAINEIKKYNKDINDGASLQSEIKGIGEKISKRIDEILDTGTLKELDDHEIDNNAMDNILLITGVGIVRAKKWIKLNIKDINDVKNAITDKKITSTHHIDIGIKYYYDFQKRIPREEIDKMKNILDIFIKKIDKSIIFEICGSYRRGALDSGDIDILLSHPNEKFLKKVIKELKNNKFIIDSLTSKGETKFMGVCKLDGHVIARRIDIREVDYSSYYAALLYFTGSKDFNVYIRNKALEKNYSLNEYGLTNLNDNSLKILNNEKEIFEILEIPYLSPTQRK